MACVDHQPVYELCVSKRGASQKQGGVLERSAMNGVVDIKHNFAFEFVQLVIRRVADTCALELGHGLIS